MKQVEEAGENVRRLDDLSHELSEQLQEHMGRMSLLTQAEARAGDAAKNVEMIQASMEAIAGTFKESSGKYVCWTSLPD